MIIYFINKVQCSTLSILIVFPFFVVQQVHLNEEILEELLYFTETPLEAVFHADLIKKTALALLLKRSSEHLSNNIDDVVAQMVYGNLRKPPGEESCVYQKLILKEQDKELIGIWAPTNPLSKAMGLKWLFPNISGPFKSPETKPIPPHIAVGYDAFKYKDVMELNTKYPGQIMKYGFFTSDIPGCAQLIAKTVEQFENRTDSTTFKEKIVIQLAKTNAECLDEFSELGPSYMSESAVEGEEECKLFFPPGYDVPEEIVSETKKKPKKKAKAKSVVPAANTDEEIATDNKDASQSETKVDTEGLEEAHEDEAGSEDKDGEEDEEDEEEEDEVSPDEIDKATSPMDSGRTQGDGNV